MNAIWPSPYYMGMLIPNSPSRLYARSSDRAAVRVAAHDMRCATLLSNIKAGSRRTCSSMPVILKICCAICCSDLEPSGLHELLKNRTCPGAINSCNVLDAASQRCHTRKDRHDSHVPCTTPPNAVHDILGTQVNVRQVSVADCRSLIPCIHRIDGLR
jgi:hypothetical protein